MPIAAVIIDDWKLPTFKRILTDAGYKFTEHDGVFPNTVCLKVEATNMVILGDIINTCNVATPDRPGGLNS